MNAVIYPRIDVEYEQPACPPRHAWARVPAEPSPDERAALKERIRRLLKERNAVMVSHYYVHPDLQDLAEETGGLVSDSLEMALRPRPFRADAGGVGCALHGRDGQDPEPRKARADARPGCHLFA